MAQKVVLDTSLLNTQHYKVRILVDIDCDVEQSREKSCVLHLIVIAMEKVVFVSPFITIGQLT